MPEEAISEVLRQSRNWGLVVSRQTGERIVAFLLHLLKWNERVNLTGARELTRLLGDHLPDSFALATLCEQGEDVADIGAGGGLPGIPFGLLRPDCRLTLVEPRGKRVAFLNAAVRAVEARSVAVVQGRLEDLPDGGCTVATSRATFPPERWLSLAQRIIRPGGRVVVFSSGQVETIPRQCTLVKRFIYTTANGAPRWSGSFTFG